MIIYKPNNCLDPDGIGTITIDDQVILIQSIDICPKVSNNEYYDIINIGINLEDNYQKGLGFLIQILRDNHVSHVYDTDLSNDFNIHNPMFELKDWIYLLSVLN